MNQHYAIVEYCVFSFDLTITFYLLFFQHFKLTLTKIQYLDLECLLFGDLT